jgi:hypothetical protein
METPRKPFNYRAFVAVAALVSGFGLPITGIANHVYAFDPMSMARHAWMTAHNMLGFLFVIFSVWHVALNRRSLWNHLKSSVEQVRAVSREAVIAGVLVTGLTLLFVSHAFFVGR